MINVELSLKTQIRKFQMHGTIKFTNLKSFLKVHSFYQKYLANFVSAKVKTRVLQTYVVNFKFQNV